MKLTEERTKKIPIPNDSDNGFVIIKNLELDELWQIDQKTSSNEMDVSMNTKFSFNPAEREKLKVIACMKEWGNLFGEDGSPLKLTVKNIKLSRRFIVVDDDDNRFRFFEWVDDERKKFAAEVEKEEAQAEEN